VQAVTMTRMLLCSEDSLLARGLESVLREVEGFELLPSCHKLAGLMEHMARGAPDLLLLDLTPDVTFAVLSEIRRAMPQSKIVLWVNSIPTELAFQALALGIRGILRKTLTAELHVKCLQRVQSGDLWFEKALASSLVAGRVVILSPSEGHLISLLSQGLKNKEIAAGLGISKSEVNVSLSAVIPEGRREGPFRASPVRLAPETGRAACIHAFPRSAAAGNGVA
jgi:DNA-binding NarL/FixJ family response regulator